MDIIELQEEMREDLRFILGMSQAKFAKDLAHIDPVTLSRFIRGEGVMPETFNKINQGLRSYKLKVNKK